MDIKRELKGGDSGNREIAKDIAAFSVEGGLIFIGVDEDTTPPSLHPVKLDGLTERIEQVGLSRVDDPVLVTTIEIQSTTDPTHGFLVVEVPVSSQAPHMADGKYYSRGDTTRNCQDLWIEVLSGDLRSG